MGKTVKGKEKVKVKLAEAKKKIARKVKGCAVLAFSLLIAQGCMKTPQGSRTTHAEHGDVEPTIKIVIDEKAHSNTVSVPVSITIGDSALASADSAGSTETQSLTPTMDIKPDLDVNYNGPTRAAAGALETLLGNGAGAIAQ